MSWKAEIKVAGEDKFHANSLRFATRDEAVRYALNVFDRWKLVMDTQVVETNDPVRHSFLGDVLKELGP